MTYASVLTVVFVGRGINHRIAYGSPRTASEDEVVLVTGGASGLGLLIAQIYAMRGTSVAVLDIKELDGDASEIFGDGVLYIACDVTDRGALETAKEKIEKVVCISHIMFSLFVIGRSSVLIACFNWLLIR